MRIGVIGTGQCGRHVVNEWVEADGDAVETVPAR